MSAPANPRVIALIANGDYVSDTNLLPVGEPGVIPVSNTLMTIAAGASSSVVINAATYAYRGVIARAYVIGKTASQNCSAVFSLSDDGVTYHDVTTEAIAALATGAPSVYCLQQYIKLTINNLGAGSGDFRVILGLYK